MSLSQHKKDTGLFYSAIRRSLLKKACINNCHDTRAHKFVNLYFFVIFYLFYKSALSKKKLLSFLLCTAPPELVVTLRLEEAYYLKRLLQDLTAKLMLN